MPIRSQGWQTLILQFEEYISKAFHFQSAEYQKLIFIFKALNIKN